ncbi:hypothetical protein [Erythrobacter sp. YT30]|uniref:hypothetical protein n=1 Tax=Erythrobacter sp. YT30 TaxID=1735012 RepID=UPI00076C7BB5|nr:hypothetical protein [Erythrobacter sp. YT30]KWV92688.1 hypothetical protein AUC45_00485 [Erythrobacter sp. YT30]
MTYASLTQVRIRPQRDPEGSQTPFPPTNTRFSDGRRSLVLTDDGANHPYRASLPPHVREDLHDIPAESLWRLTKDDVRGAVTTYVAATAAIFAFII